MAVLRVEVLDEPLDVAALISSANDPSSGGIASFIGTVRETAAVDGNQDKRVTHLDYEAHPSLAAEKLTEIARYAAERWSLVRVVAVHRSGTCAVGDPTVVIVCAAAHRAEALDACRWLIDELKAAVPIWKKEIYSDGSSWVGAGA